MKTKQLFNNVWFKCYGDISYSGGVYVFRYVVDLQGPITSLTWTSCFLKNKNKRFLGFLRLNELNVFFSSNYLQNEMECAYYLRTGQCKFGSTCKFHHPQPTNMMVSMRGSPVYTTVHSPTTPGQQSYPGGVTNWSRASFIPSPRWQGPSSYAPLILPQGVVSVPGWNTYSVSFTATFIAKCYNAEFLTSWKQSGIL